jgi:ENTS family enterobactin (siderophore) exporter
MMTPVASASVSGFGLAIAGLLLLLLLNELRRFRQTPPELA